MQKIQPKKEAPSTDGGLMSIKAMAADDLAAADALISAALQDQLGLVQDVCHYIIDSGGKRIRPLLVILAAKAFDYQGDQHIKLAAIVEFLHTATLLHDDVIDHSALRRHRKTANKVWDNETSILAGDFLHALSFQMMVALGNIEVMRIISEATTVIVTGEVMQLMHRKTPNTSEKNYMAVIDKKTARLFTVAAQLGGILSKRPDADVNCLAEYGSYLGIAYQLIDDVLDYMASPETLGKSIGDDLAEGKATLPLIYAMRYGSTAESTLIREALTQGNYHQLNAIIDVIQSTQAIERTRTTAQVYIDNAMECLDRLTAAGADCSLLKKLTEFILARAY